ncbi:hypothetical protein MOF23_07310 [Bacillus inaquosorum]|uniref:hypothetical protein n=1 Tax=Bacillus inaquosorum TaxID=483913 RepID=UPI002282EB35|nr:hypothetical protein [Bacillus inaquosorum]MCY9308785.1 hypothetical protein [Bacillus inaquosorum]
MSKEFMFTLDEVKKKCQENDWLKVGGYPFQDDPFMEHDYTYNLHICSSIEELQEKLTYGNWSIRTAFSFKQLLFVNQINGGDEWWTCYKHMDGSIEAFESITWSGYIERGEFNKMINDLLKGPRVYWKETKEEKA